MNKPDAAKLEELKNGLLDHVWSTLSADERRLAKHGAKPGCCVRVFLSSDGQTIHLEESQVIWRKISNDMSN